jgi:hypothetical protein
MPVQWYICAVSNWRLSIQRASMDLMPVPLSSKRKKVRQASTCNSLYNTSGPGIGSSLKVSSEVTEQAIPKSCLVHHKQNQPCQFQEMPVVYHGTEGK